MILKVINKLREKHYYSRQRLKKLSRDELLAIIRHDCHRIEKSVYNNIFQAKRSYYEHKKEKVLLIFSILKDKNCYTEDHPVIRWALKIINNINNLETDFVLQNKSSAQVLNPQVIDEVTDIFKSRRSCRTWSISQPNEDELKALAYKMVDAARWAPNSGNRQAWRFSIITKEEDKMLLKGLKEEHCYSAPLLLFIGMDSRLYSPAYHLKDCMYIDAGAAIMQMANIASFSGIGFCWNHLSEDLIKSRKKNKIAYKNFCKKLKIEDHIKPVAILSIGNVEYLPPAPDRLSIEELLIN